MNQVKSERIRQIMKIVRIISTTAVVINAGTKQGIKKGDILTIMDTTGTPIKDPETNQNIGMLESIKANVIATKVYDNMTIAESEMENKHPLIPDYLNSKRTSALKEIEKSVGVLVPSRKELNVNLDEIQGLPMSDKPIQVGDSVQKRQ